MSIVQQVLLTKTLVLLTTMLASGVAAAWVLRRIFHAFFIVGAFVTSVVLILLARPITQSGDVSAIFFLAVVFGASVGADIGGLAQVLGSQRGLTPRKTLTVVAVALALTTLITVLAGMISILGGMNLQALGPWLFGGLWLLICLGIAGIVVSIQKGAVRTIAAQKVEYFFGMAAALFWALYMVYHFNKISEAVVQQADWSTAMSLAMGLYLDFVNFFVRILPYMLELLTDS